MGTVDEEGESRDELRARCALGTTVPARSHSLTHPKKTLHLPLSRARKHISFGEATEKNVDQIRKLNLAVFPVRYNDKFYSDLTAPDRAPYTHLGAACCHGSCPTHRPAVCPRLVNEPDSLPLRARSLL